MLLIAMPSMAKQDGKFTAGTILKDFSTDQLNYYMTGIVHGLAYARYEREGKKTNGGMKCIMDWYFNGGQAASQIVKAFDRYKKHTPNAIIAAMIKQQCGK